MTSQAMNVLVPAKEVKFIRFSTLTKDFLICLSCDVTMSTRFGVFDSESETLIFDGAHYKPCNQCKQCFVRLEREKSDD